MKNFSEAVRFEEYRLMVISTWPESGHKRAALAAARAALERERKVMTPGPGDEPTLVARVAA